MKRVLIARRSERTRTGAVPAAVQLRVTAIGRLPVAQASSHGRGLLPEHESFGIPATHRPGGLCHWGFQDRRPVPCRSSWPFDEPPPRFRLGNRRANLLELAQVAIDLVKTRYHRVKNARCLGVA